MAARKNVWLKIMAFFGRIEKICPLYSTQVPGKWQPCVKWKMILSSSTLIQLCLLFPLFSYSICIRAEEGFCCIEYQLCNDANSMSLGTETLAVGDTIAYNSATDCLTDYLGIHGDF